MRVAGVFVALLVATACHKTPAGDVGAPSSTTDQDALWKLAPSDTMFGAIASPRALAMLEHAWGDLRALMASTPELEPALVKIGAMVATPDLSFASLGLTATKGAALFMIGPNKGIAILPVGDRDKFLAATHGMRGSASDKLDAETTCMETHGVYACASDPALFDRLGNGTLSAAPAGARGDIEFAARGLPIDDKPTSFAGVVQLARGAVVLRGTIAGLPPKLLLAMGSASEPRIDGDRTTGFAVGHLKNIIALSPAANDDELFGSGYTIAAVARTIDDPLTLTMEAQSFDARVPLTDPAPLHALLIARCEQLHGHLADGACRIDIPNVQGIAVDVWLDGYTLRAGQKGVAAGPVVELPPLGKELAASPWQFAMYGHGSILGAGALLAQQTQLAQLSAQADEGGNIARVAVRVATFINEIGAAVRIDHDQLRIVLGVRTAWANSDEVVTRLLAIPAKAVLEGKGDQLVAPIIAAAPSSPLANDVKAGFGGMLVQTAMLGGMAAASIPAFMDYMSRAKESDVTLQLGRLGRMLVRTYGETQAFPVGDSAVLPAGQCCGQAGNKCFADPTAFASDKIWNQIGFVLEESIAYQFRYHSDDGKSATVQAVGDLECDGKQAIYTLRVTIDPSTRGATYTIEPPHGVY
ncbi:MAG TPA: hypothetical protein VH143_14400 [Kofleriaceae bacterium]|nr:hypothetical protein [Kofleriaceae bacterium]